MRGEGTAEEGEAVEQSKEQDDGHIGVDDIQEQQDVGLRAPPQRVTAECRQSATLPTRRRLRFTKLTLIVCVCAASFRISIVSGPPINPSSPFGLSRVQQTLLIGNGSLKSPERWSNRLLSMLPSGLTIVLLYSTFRTCPLWFKMPHLQQQSLTYD